MLIGKKKPSFQNATVLSLHPNLLPNLEYQTVIKLRRRIPVEI